MCTDEGCGWRMQQRKLITSSLAHYGSQKERKGDLFFFSIGRMIHAPSRMTASIFFRLVRVPFLPSHSRLSFPSYAALAFHFLFVSFFFFTRWIQFLHSMDAFSIFSDFYRHRVAFAYRFRCARHPRKRLFYSFQHHALPASFLSLASGCVPACDSNRGWRTCRRINLFRLKYCTYCGRKSRNTKTVMVKMGLKSINSCSLVASSYYNNEIITSYSV